MADSNITEDDVYNVVNLAKKFIANNDLAELNNSILYGSEFDNFRRVYGDDYIEVIHRIIMEYGHIQVGGCPPCFAFLGRLFGKKAIKKGVEKARKRAKREAKEEAKRRAREERDDRKKSWF